LWGKSKKKETFFSIGRSREGGLASEDLERRVAPQRERVGLAFEKSRKVASPAETLAAKTGPKIEKKKNFLIAQRAVFNQPPALT